MHHTERGLVRWKSRGSRRSALILRGRRRNQGPRFDGLAADSTPLRAAATTSEIVSSRNRGSHRQRRSPSFATARPARFTSCRSMARNVVRSPHDSEAYEEPNVRRGCPRNCRRAEVEARSRVRLRSHEGARHQRVSSRRRVRKQRCLGSPSGVLSDFSPKSAGIPSVCKSTGGKAGNLVVRVATRRTERSHPLTRDFDRSHPRNRTSTRIHEAAGPSDFSPFVERQKTSERQGWQRAPSKRLTENNTSAKSAHPRTRSVARIVKCAGRRSRSQRAKNDSSAIERNDSSPASPQGASWVFICTTVAVVDRNICGRALQKRAI